MPKDLIIGIDPGISGGFGVLSVSDPDWIELCTMPATVVQNGKRQQHEYDLAVAWTYLATWKAQGVRAVWIERGGTRPGQHAMAVYKTGYGVGLWHGMLVGMNLPIRWVYPVVWKRAQGLLKQDKRASRLMVQERWPKVGALKASQEGAAEALLIADYGRKEDWDHDGKRVS